jgi:hypothetical protein
MPPHFRWTTFDVRDLLPSDWQQDITIVASNADFRNFPRTPILTREGGDVPHVSRGRVHADTVREKLPWLYDAYRTRFLDLAEEVTGGDPVRTAADDRYGIVLNVQRGTKMRFECHVDSNPLTGLLFCTDHPGGGGELVFGNDTSATEVSAVEQSCSAIRPQAGHLIFFDARQYAHYARALKSEHDLRVVAAMNFYTGSYPESTRPRTLNEHLFGDPVTSPE